MLVPISVQVPPRIEKKLRGISTFDGLISNCRHSDSKIGTIMITIGVLFKKALLGTTTSAVSSRSWGRLPAAARPILMARKSRAPVLISARERTNMEAIVSVASLAKPLKTASGPSSSPGTRARQAMMRIDVVSIARIWLT